MEETLALLKDAHNGDKTAREKVFHKNIGLVYSVIKRFTGRGLELEDLSQIGSIGLLKAVDNFDETYQVRFSTYAVPMIIGEIRRYLRDDGMIKVSRSLKEKNAEVNRVREMLEKKLGREPTIKELSEESGIVMEEMTMIIEAGYEVESLQRTVYQGEGQEILLQDKIPEEENGQEMILNRILLEGLLEDLKDLEREILFMRYFQNMTQIQVAKKLNMTQVQVSRAEKKILTNLRKKL